MHVYTHTHTHARTHTHAQTSTVLEKRHVRWREWNSTVEGCLLKIWLIFSPDWFALCTGVYLVLLQRLRLVIFAKTLYTPSNLQNSFRIFKNIILMGKTFLMYIVRKYKLFYSMSLPLFLHSTLETTFDTTVTTEVNGRSIPALAARSSPMSWRLGQSQTPRLQAGDAPSMPSGYAAPRASTTGAGTTTGRYSGHSDPSRFVYI